MFDFRRKTLFCLGYRLSKHKMTIYSKNSEGMAPLGPPGPMPPAGALLDVKSRPSVLQ